MISVSVFELNIAPAISCTLSVFKVTSPDETVKSVASKDAIPLLVSEASSAETVNVLPETEVSIPSPPAIVNVSFAKLIAIFVELSSARFKVVATLPKLNPPEPSDKSA